MTRVFIDGGAGTTGLRIRERLSARRDLELVVLGEETRKDFSARRDAMNSSGVVFLCLPDDAAREAVGMLENPDTVLIDTSTAHRTADGWEYGFPELSARRARIACAKRIANPGCHATGFIALVEPLVRAGLLPRDAALCAFSLTGYSGGGKKMIAEYDSVLPAVGFMGGRQYALGQQHKHLPEMAKICNLERPPVFSPVIVPHYSGMQTSVMLHADATCGSLERIAQCYADCYSGNGVVRYVPQVDLPPVLSSGMLSGRDDMVVTVHGCGERIVLSAIFDNLGKGASGAAIQNMNLAIGADETEGLCLS